MQRGTQHACMNAMILEPECIECNKETTFNACDQEGHMHACNVQWEKMFACNWKTRLHPCKKTSTRPSMHWATKLAGTNVGTSMGAYSYSHSFCFASTKFFKMRLCEYEDEYWDFKMRLCEYEYEYWNFKMRVRVRVMKFQNANMRVRVRLLTFKNASMRVRVSVRILKGKLPV